MEELFSPIAISVIGIIIGILSFFLKKTLNDVEKLKEAETENKVLSSQVQSIDRHFEEFKKDTYKKYSKFYAKFEKQEELNSTFKESLSSILAKLDMLLSQK
jgi:uncharacterized membrane protein (DUF106 family)